MAHKPEITGETRIPEYIAGDPIVIDRFSFVHQMNVVQVIAMFVHSNTGYEIELLGDPRSERSFDDKIFPEKSLKPSSVVLEGRVEAEDPPGEYRCQTIEAYTAGGERRSFDEIPNDFRFEVVKEPTRPPHITGTILLGEQRVRYGMHADNKERDEPVK